MASNFNKAERYVKQGDEYKLLSYATSSESVEMTNGTDLQTKIDNIDAEIDTKIDSVKIGTTEYKSGTTVTLPVYTKNEADSTFGADIALTIDTSTYKMTLELKDNKGQILSSKEIDFPIESMVVNASYANRTLTLTLQNGNDINVDISSIISGLVPDTRTIAGVDLKDNITATELRTALNVADGAEVNQNAFSNVKVGTTTIAADTTTDTLTLAGSNVTLTPDTTNDKVTIGITKDNVTTALGYTPPTTNTTYGVVSTTANGLCPKRGGTTTKFLRDDGTWAVPPDTNTTYSNMTAATASAAGKAGLVPAPAAGKQTSFLRGDGTWVVPTNTTYSNFVKSGSSAKAGLVPAPSTTAGTTKYLREDGTWQVPPKVSVANNLTTTTTGMALDAIQGKALNDKIDTLNSNLGKTFQGRGWVPNGADLSSLLIGVYSTNPNNLPSVGIPDGYSPYGALIAANDIYTPYIYNDVFGNLASYNTNQGGWVKYYSQASVDTLINNSKVKRIDIDDAVVTSNTIGKTSPFYGSGYTHYGCTAGNSRANIDTLISQGHTVLGGFISRGACNDSEFVNNVASLSGMVVDYNTYAGCPYQVVFVSNGYQTMHCKITILYI